MAAMTTITNDGQLRELVQRACARLTLPAAQCDARVQRLAIASDFAIDVLARQPPLLQRLLDDARTPLPAPVLAADNPGDWQPLLRRYRHAESTRLIWRDVVEGADVGEILAGSTALAETCLRIALAAAQDALRERYGQVRDGDGNPVAFVVFALGKLGGAELNFSSDVDLVYGYTAAGESDGRRVLAAEDYFARLGQQLAKLLDETTVDGFCHRVDLRLRPFGSAGRIALSFAAMEQYFQREGRDWERYAWQKARAMAGDTAAGDAFLATLRPFVYRRYLDFGALDGLRTMKASIAAEVARKELQDDIKRGPGGIREAEFLVQALQLIRGGREPALRQSHFLTGLHALMQADCIAPASGAALANAYRFLRRLENRLQMLADAQTQQLPEDALAQTRIALGLGYADWDALLADLERVRGCIADEFAALLAPRKAAIADANAALQQYWQALPDTAAPDALAHAGFTDVQALHGALADFTRAPGVGDLSDPARARLDRVMPLLLHAAAASPQPDAALRRVLPLLQNILRRSSYLALLDEQPGALARLVEAAARSGLLAERVAAHPMLLDELLDARAAGELPDRAQLHAHCCNAVAAAGDDVEAALHALNETRQALSFRIGLAALDARQSAHDSARQLAWLADAVVATVVALAQREMRRAHGDLHGAAFAALGYGSLGGEELGFGSDLDLVFLYEADTEQASDGARPLEAARWFARLAQKIVALLQIPTHGGKLYEVDVRLRPDGAKGLLVSSIDSYAGYQQSRAWTWELQALVRARCVSGDPGLCARFEQVRADALARPREATRLAQEVRDMRRKMRAELDRSGAGGFDLKQGEGGLVDLEFLLQYLVLRDAAACPALLPARATPALIQAVREAGIWDAHTAAQALQAHAALLEASLGCTLDRRARIVQETAGIAQARAAIRALWAACELDGL